tara:strand:+ start:762 stop:1115 length:354 start_codon:yes stop_codon:yes gene_type:complete
MSIIDNAKKHFADKLSGELQSVEVPEWSAGEKVEKIYFKPSMTLKQQGQILALSQEGKAAEALATTLILRGLDADGKRLFNNANLFEFMQSVDPDVVARIVSEMSGSEFSDEELEKN